MNFFLRLSAFLAGDEDFFLAAGFVNFGFQRPQIVFEFRGKAVLFFPLRFDGIHKAVVGFFLFQGFFGKIFVAFFQRQHRLAFPVLGLQFVLFQLLMQPFFISNGFGDLNFRFLQLFRHFANHLIHEFLRIFRSINQIIDIRLENI